MKKLFLSLFLSTFTLTLSAQKLYSGKVQANEVGVPHVMVIIEHGKEYLGATTEGDGSFLFRLEAGDTTTVLRFLINESKYAPLDTLCSLKKPLLFTLEPIAKELGEATAKGQRTIERHEGNIRSYRPDLKGLPKHALADKALRQVPGLSFQNGNFVIPGKEGAVTFFINGVLASEQRIKTLEAKDILRIEVQDYDYKEDLPNGSVNIVLKEKSQRLLYTGLGSHVGVARRAFYLNPEVAYYGGNLLLSYNGDYHHQKQDTYSHVERTHESGSSDYYTFDTRTLYWQHRSEVAGTWFINDKNTLSFDYHLLGGTNHNDKDIDHSGSLSHTKAKGSFSTQTALLDFKHAFNTRSRLILKAWGNRDAELYADARYADDVYSRTQSLALQASMEIDSLAIGKTKHSLSYGYKSLFRENIIHGSAAKPYNTVYQLFVVDEWKLSPSLTGVGSLRTEYATIGTRGYKKRFFHLLPQLSLKYTHKKWGNGTIGYQSAVYRPAADYLNPAIKRENDYSSVQGNPHLLPERSQKFTLSYSKQLKSTLLSFSASHTFGKEQIRDVYETSGGYNVYTFANIGSENTTRLSLNVYQALLNGRMVFNGGTTLTRANYYLPTLAGLLSLENRGWGADFFLNWSYLTTQEWQYELSINYTNKKLLPTTTLRTYRPAFSLSVEKEVGKHWTLGALCSDYIADYHYTYHLRGVVQKKTWKLNNFNLYFTVRYRLGSPFEAGITGKNEGASDLKTTRK